MRKSDSVSGVCVFLLVLFVTGCSKSEGPSAQEPEKLAVAVDGPPVTSPSAAGTDAAQISEQLLATYQQTCGNCHERGIVGAPATGDVAAWAPRVALGMETLVGRARNGFKAMPPAGLCYNCSDEDFAQLIRYMSSEK
ncbi:c-type cytochrome [Microbulbifer bruguierae]|uniref:C-type cytochrome n=1 Tax=Microbulbifer bruguierae TaxID=3029061 RepID=A0ABY8NFI1_9GAMM|nr:c-type cytochrome [Microbulbifer bruguierae]WGL17700.1 c-type cytochrome [Microbulbifer bruguierae]